MQDLVYLVQGLSLEQVRIFMHQREILSLVLVGSLCASCKLEFTVLFLKTPNLSSKRYLYLFHLGGFIIFPLTSFILLKWSCFFQSWSWKVENLSPISVHLIKPNINHREILHDHSSLCFCLLNAFVSSVSVRISKTFWNAALVVDSST